MKTVVANPYHFWANQTQSFARNSTGSRSFEGVSAYSYCTVVAIICESVKGQHVYLLTSRNYSVTTTGHMSMIRQAIPNDSLVFYVPQLGCRDSDHKENVRWLWEKVAEFELKSQRARSESNKGWYAGESQRFLGLIGQYIDLFKVKGVKKPTGYQVGQAAIALAAYKKSEAAARKVQKAKELKEAQEALDKWKAGERVYRSFYGLGSAYLRVVGEHVETTHQATVPLDHVQRAMPMVLRFVESGKAFKCPPDTPIRLGHYSLSEITAAGTVIIGCHRFEKAEVLRFAKVLEVVA